MSKVKYRVCEYIPTGKSLGTHSWYAETVINNDIDNAELAAKIAARTGFKAYECQAVVAAIADIVAEEIKESNRVFLADEKGMKMVSIYPKVQGSVSDDDVKANPEKYKGATEATEAMVTPDLLTWTVGATVGIKFSKVFALNKQAQKVKMTASDVTESTEEEENGGTSGDNQGGDNQGGSGDNQGGGSGDNQGGGGDNQGGGGDNQGGGGGVE